MRDESVSDIDQIPYLGGLPWVGALFRHRSETTQKHEILVLITPRIVYEPETCLEGSGEICRVEERHAEFAANMSPFGRQSAAPLLPHGGEAPGSAVTAQPPGASSTGRPLRSRLGGRQEPRACDP